MVNHKVHMHTLFLTITIDYKINYAITNFLNTDAICNPLKLEIVL